jgi:gliding motility-associated lipoprotein GldK
MRRLALLSLVAAVFLSGCGLFGNQTGKNGELTGVTDRPQWDNPIPLGMVTIPAGSFHIGNNEQDVPNSQVAYNRQITVSSFYMDDTEISNNEYRQFIQASKEQGEDSFQDSVINFLIDYYAPRDTTSEDYQEMIYPDTLVWLRDFSYSYNEPLVENYWWHPAFDNYPVVGVNWYAAQAFCNWRTQLYNRYRQEQDKTPLPRFRLPTEAEWEYAARGGFQHNIYPWRGPYTRNSKGCFLCNFKPGRGDYIGDNYEYTAPIKSYWPNDYGLYCMPGNVAEWTEDNFSETGYSYAHDLNPVFRYDNHMSKENRRRVIRGGSWKDVAYFCSVGSRTYEYSDTTKSYIGFRSVVSVLGRSGAANAY